MDESISTGSAKSRPELPAGWSLDVSADYETLSRQAAGFILGAIRRKPESLLCLPTGSSPARVYELLAAEHRQDPSAFAAVRIIKLDEWGGLAMDDPASCETALQKQILQPLGIAPERYFAWHSQPKDPAAECSRVAAWLALHGPIDLCLLGIGINGHLGLNEPDEALLPGPHVAQLTPESLQHGMLREARTPPRFGLTLGLADLLQSRRVVLLASGLAKAVPMQRFFWREIFTDCPASLLWLHPRVSVFCDEPASSRIPAFP